MILSETIVSLINEQIAMEANAHMAYLAMATRCEYMGLPGASKYFGKSSVEENQHRDKFIEYLTDLDAIAIMPNIPALNDGIRLLPSLINDAFDLEKSVTAHLQQIDQAADDEGDELTDTFLIWFFDEQRKSLAELLNIQRWFIAYGTDGAALAIIDEKIGEL